MHAREGELLKENRQLNDRLLQEERELKTLRAFNRQTKDKIKMAKQVLAIEEGKTNE
jgi:hypothetical protein